MFESRERTMRMIFIGLLAITIASRSQATTARAPWDWTADERIAQRTNPATVERLRIAPTSSQRFILCIEGRYHPELLLPTELLRNLLSGLRGRPEGLAILRQAYAPVVTRLNLSDHLLDELLAMSADYVDRETRIQDLNAQLASRPGVDETRILAERDSLSPLQCSALHDALTSARKRYGRLRFDRFLYEAVAPGMVITMTEPDQPAQLIQWERGCR
jgi:hypothetical protein